MPFAGNSRELEMTILNEVTQTEKETTLLRVAALDEISFNCSTSTDDFTASIWTLSTGLCKEIPKLELPEQDREFI